MNKICIIPTSYKYYNIASQVSEILIRNGIDSYVDYEEELLSYKISRAIRNKHHYSIFSEIESNLIIIQVELYKSDSIIVRLDKRNYNIDYHSVFQLDELSLLFNEFKDSIISKKEVDYFRKKLDREKLIKELLED